MIVVPMLAPKMAYSLRFWDGLSLDRERKVSGVMTSIASERMSAIRDGKEIKTTKRSSVLQQLLG